MINSIFLAITKNHCLYSEVKKKFPHDQYLVVDPNSSEDIELEEHYKLIDLTLFLTGNEKRDFLKKLGPRSIISDLTCYDGEGLCKEIPALSGAIATAFPSPKNSVEFFAKDEVTKKTILEFGKLFNLNPVEVSTPGFGFIYPRTLALIINEAYFALQENLANTSDIDTAMKFGVNYPLGPFEWSKIIGLDKIFILLNELETKTGKSRYKTCPFLYEEAKKYLSL